MWQNYKVKLVKELTNIKFRVVVTSRGERKANAFGKLQR